MSDALSVVVQGRVHTTSHPAKSVEQLGRAASCLMTRMGDLSRPQFKRFFNALPTFSIFVTTPPPITITGLSNSRYCVFEGPAMIVRGCSVSVVGWWKLQPRKSNLHLRFLTVIFVTQVPPPTPITIAGLSNSRYCVFERPAMIARGGSVSVVGWRKLQPRKLNLHLRFFDWDFHHPSPPHPNRRTFEFAILRLRRSRDYDG